MLSEPQGRVWSGNGPGLLWCPPPRSDVVGTGTSPGREEGKESDTDPQESGGPEVLQPYCSGAGLLQRTAQDAAAVGGGPATLHVYVGTFVHKVDRMHVYQEEAWMVQSQVVLEVVSQTEEGGNQVVWTLHSQDGDGPGAWVPGQAEGTVQYSRDMSQAGSVGIPGPSVGVTPVSGPV